MSYRLSHVLLLVLALAMSPYTARADYAYITATDADNISIIDTTSNTVVKTISVGDTPIAVAVNPLGNQILVPNQVSDSMSVISPYSHSVTTTVSSICNSPIGVAFCQMAAKHMLLAKMTM